MLCKMESLTFENMRISSYRYFLSYNHCFRRCFKLVFGINVVMATLTTGIMFPLFTCMHFWVWGILRSFSACALTTYEAVHGCQTFQKHCPVFIYECMEHRWNDIGRIKPKNSDKNLSQCHFVNHKFHMD
jgi:hypothetical protein